MVCNKSASRAHCPHLQSDGYLYCCWCGGRMIKNERESARLVLFPVVGKRGAVSESGNISGDK